MPATAKLSAAKSFPFVIPNLLKPSRLIFKKGSNVFFPMIPPVDASRIDSCKNFFIVTPVLL